MAGYIYKPGVSPNTRLVNTQRVKLFSFGGNGAVGGSTYSQVGLLQTWNPTESRAIEPHRGIGWGDQIAELGVGVTDLTATITVMMLYTKGIMEIFGYHAGSEGIVRSLKHHCWPFDVREDLYIPAFLDTTEGLGTHTTTGDAELEKDINTGAAAKIIRTFYIGCWMNDFNKSFNVGETAVAQDCTITITDVKADLTDSTSSLLYADSNKTSSQLFTTTAAAA